MKLIVCPVIHAPRGFETYKPSHVLGILSPGEDEAVLPGTPAHRLEVRFNDIAAPQDGLVPPDESQMRAVLNFAESWDKSAPMLIYCFAGISRSTAAAFAVACQHAPKVAEREIAAALRKASPSATPNALMIALTDSLLKRESRMSDAAFSIGRGEGFFEGYAFELSCQSFT